MKKYLWGAVIPAVALAVLTPIAAMAEAGAGLDWGAEWHKNLYFDFGVDISRTFLYIKDRDNKRSGDWFFPDGGPFPSSVSGKIGYAFGAGIFRQIEVNAALDLPIPQPARKAGYFLHADGRDEPGLLYPGYGDRGRQEDAGKVVQDASGKAQLRRLTVDADTRLWSIPFFFSIGHGPTAADDTITYSFTDLEHVTFEPFDYAMQSRFITPVPVAEWGNASARTMSYAQMGGHSFDGVEDARITLGVRLPGGFAARASLVDAADVDAVLAWRSRRIRAHWPVEIAAHAMWRGLAGRDEPTGLWGWHDDFADQQPGWVDEWTVFDHAWGGSLAVRHRSGLHAAFGASASRRSDRKINHVWYGPAGVEMLDPSKRHDGVHWHIAAGYDADLLRRFGFGLTKVLAVAGRNENSAWPEDETRYWKIAAAQELPALGPVVFEVFAAFSRVDYHWSKLCRWVDHGGRLRDEDRPSRFDIFVSGLTVKF